MPAAAGAGIGAGLAALPAMLLCRIGTLLAHPISGTDKKLAPAIPKNSLRDAISLPVP